MSPVSPSRVARRVSGATKPPASTGEAFSEASTEPTTTGLQRPPSLRTDADIAATLSDESRRVISAIEADLHADLIAVVNAFYRSGDPSADGHATAEANLGSA